MPSTWVVTSGSEPLNTLLLPIPRIYISAFALACATLTLGANDTKSLILVTSEEFRRSAENTVIAKGVFCSSVSPYLVAVTMTSGMLSIEVPSVPSDIAACAITDDANNSVAKRAIICILKVPPVATHCGSDLIRRFMDRLNCAGTVSRYGRKVFSRNTALWDRQSSPSPQSRRGRGRWWMRCSIFSNCRVLPLTGYYRAGYLVGPTDKPTF